MKGKMKDEKTEQEKSVFNKLKEPKIIAIEFFGIVFIILFLILSNSSVCADRTFIYENVNVPAKVCLTRNINYNDGGVMKNAVFTEDFIKSLKITK